MKYYVYTHSTPECAVFYVGKGCRDRAFSSGKRPHSWSKKVLECGGLNVRIEKYFANECDAFEYEALLIKKYLEEGRVLLNKTNGGKGVSGYVQDEALRERKRMLLTGYKHKTVCCPVCGTSGGETSMKRWHFDKCRGVKKYKARTTVNGKRVFLGNHATKDHAAAAVKQYIEGLV